MHHLQPCVLALDEIVVSIVLGVFKLVLPASGLLLPHRPCHCPMKADWQIPESVA
jgi:hypothetical protein